MDVGCGPAVMTQAMLERGCSFWDVDPSPRMIEISRKLFQENERVHFLPGDAMRIWIFLMVSSMRCSAWELLMHFTTGIKPCGKCSAY